jgi:hypothetical protein
MQNVNHKTNLNAILLVFLKARDFTINFIIKKNA